MTFLKIAKGAVGLCASIVLLSGCLKEDYPHTELFTWKAKVDVTDKAALTVNLENSAGPSGGEGSAKVVDNNFTTKFLINPYQNTLYMQLAFPQPQQVASYTLTSGDDAPGRDPKDWKLSGSVDGATWVDLDIKTGEVFSGRRLTRTFSFKNKVAYKFYRLSVTANNNDALFQLTEWRVIEVPEELQ
ncbi:discoidin domain-containing protein [Pedobacter frigiditerrae]|uniref:Discoidin domain-containing protein n=1 Tax=Pedobacter frigiditerrae TaxID=2530452 RepID=A0A4R0MJ85_9SPHI|nr:discoidin domain-containing protein [Pedobacter frigiditerrae]TCC86670.1 discoidin domain-containing protein [Pedobacter frigiditerrae]